MSCKLLLNLVECIKARSEKETCVNKGRELLMRMNEVFVLKFKTVAKMQLPVLMAKHKQAFQQVKLKSEEMERLLNIPYVNEGILRGQK